MVAGAGGEISGELKLTDALHNYSAVAVQGPRVKEFINAVVPGASVSARRVNTVTELKKNEIGGFSFEHGGVLVSRTGYTGEDGFEIVGGDEALENLGKNSHCRHAVWHQAVRPRRARHAPHGGLLSAIRS